MGCAIAIRTRHLPIAALHRQPARSSRGSLSEWGKHTAMTWANRVPLLFAVPGGSGGVVSEGFAELVDVYPTLADLAGRGGGLVGWLPPWKRKGRYNVVGRVHAVIMPSSRRHHVATTR